MAAVVKGNFETMAGVKTALDEAVNGSVERSDQTNLDMDDLITQVDDVALAAYNTFGQRSGELITTLERSQTALGVEGWEGDSKVAAVAAETHFRGRIRDVSDAATQAMNTLKANLATSLADFKAEMDSTHGLVLREMSEEYGRLGQGTTDLATAFQDADQMIQFQG